MTERTRVAVVGSRDFNAPNRVKAAVKKMRRTTIVISGGARGVDTWAVDFARERGLETEVYPADWKKYGHRAGYLHNETLVEKADYVIAFWDGESKGTIHSIRLALKAGKLHSVCISSPDSKSCTFSSDDFASKYLQD